MNKMDNNVAVPNSQHFSGADSACVAAPLQTLMNLDRYLSASGYDASHPWRLEIGTAVTSGKTDLHHPLREVAIGRARDAVDMAAIGASFINDNILPAVYALVELIEIHESGDAEAGRYACPLLPLAKLTRQLTENAAGCLEDNEREMQAKLAVVEGDEA
ncbi:hypothetical protein F2P45_06275 [Massilia sp. CCM 8733]|uniref:Uncharacterized protein n=1 Tax=Massilia mucilaginosa TaxID=2609282 RepID=A0ABX0NPB8_9BURK|nr:hypothetical protein [Massilia mucilaginosa]NHZ88630.1 hypothetical protein [Massilia mucilaginosa]